jgi:diguanylate cyclase (GGDEF)-like protein/PAS domain S-box-containing protein
MRFRSLQIRFMLLVIAGAGLFALVAAPMTYELGYQRAINNGRDAINDLVSAFEKTAAVAAFTSDTQLLQEVVDGLGRNPVVAVAEIRTSQDAVARYVSSQASPVADAEGVMVEHQLVSPFDAHEVIGKVHVDADMAQMKISARREAMLLTLLMVLQVAILAGILYLGAMNFVSRPIVGVAGQLRTAQPGTSQRFAVPRGHEDDEIGMLVDGANALLQANEDALERERRLREEIASMEAQYRQIFDSTSAGIFVLNSERRLINANPTVLKVICYPVQEARKLRDKNFIEAVFADPQRVGEMIAQSLHTNNTMSADLELARSGDMPGRWVHCLISARGSGDSIEMIEGVIYDITERKQAEYVVRHQAEHDSLTGLKNRAASEAAIEHFVAEAKLHSAHVAVLYIDLDGFKHVNDTLGHKAGDHVLQICARRMLTAMRRTSDLVGRIGGDEFIIALYDNDVGDIALSQVVVALIESLCRPITLDGGYVARVGASIGVASYPLHGKTGRQVINAADEAMYYVKNHGKSAFAVAMMPRVVAEPLNKLRA